MQATQELQQDERHCCVCDRIDIEEVRSWQGLRTGHRRQHLDRLNETEGAEFVSVVGGGLVSLRLFRGLLGGPVLVPAMVLVHPGNRNRDSGLLLGCRFSRGHCQLRDDCLDEQGADRDEREKATPVRLHLPLSAMIFVLDPAHGSQAIVIISITMAYANRKRQSQPIDLARHDRPGDDLIGLVLSGIDLLIRQKNNVLPIPSFIDRNTSV